MSDKKLVDQNAVSPMDASEQYNRILQSALISPTLPEFSSILKKDADLRNALQVMEQIVEVRQGREDKKLTGEMERIAAVYYDAYGGDFWKGAIALRAKIVERRRKVADDKLVDKVISKYNKDNPNGIDYS